MLFSFIISVLTLTVVSKSEVSSSGVVPENVQYSYVNTYRGGQLTEGNTATLTLTGLGDIQISRVSLSMRSNQSSGAGSLVMSRGKTTVWEIADAPFSSPSWGGLFTTDYIDVTHSFSNPVVAGNEPLTITISASANSLYINSYTIEYTIPQRRAYTVSFSVPTGMAPRPLTELSVGGGVVLPEVSFEEGDWHFLGWTELPIKSSTVCPFFYSPGEIYYPTYDGMLYALYSDDYAGQSIAASYPETGHVYLVVLQDMGLALSGAINDGFLALKNVSEMLCEGGAEPALCPKNIDYDMVYHTVVERDTLVRIYHYKDNSPIGFSGGKLTAAASTWILRQRQKGDYDLLAQEKDVYKRLYMTMKVVGGSSELTAVLADMDDKKSGWLFYDVTDWLNGANYSAYPPGYVEGLTGPTEAMKARKIWLDGRLLINVHGMVFDGMGVRVH